MKVRTRKARSAAERMRRYRQRQRAAGLRPVTRWTAGAPLWSDHRPRGRSGDRHAPTGLYTSGLRRGEIGHLTLGDYDPVEHVLLVRDTKFYKSPSQKTPRARSDATSRTAVALASPVGQMRRSCSTAAAPVSPPTRATGCAC